MEEQHQQPESLPLATSEESIEVRSGLRCVIFGLAQYLYQFPDDSKERQRCFEALDALVMRLQIGHGKDVSLQGQESAILHAFGGFLQTLYNLQPSSTDKDHLRLSITDWCARIKEHFERQ
jgi:hypothetical protein